MLKVEVSDMLLVKDLYYEYRFIEENNYKIIIIRYLEGRYKKKVLVKLN